MKTEFGKGFLEHAAWGLLCLFVFAIPWEKTVLLPGIGTLTRLFGIVAFAAGALAAIRRRSWRAPNVALLLAVLFVAWSAMTYLWSFDRPATLTRVTSLAELLAMMWLIWESCRGPARQRQLLQAYVTGAVAGAALSFVRYSLRIETYYRRYAAPGFDPNDFGLVLTLSIPMALYLALKAKTWQRWMYGCAALIAILSIFLTASRTALIATVVAFGFAAWTWRRASVRQRVLTAALFGVVVFGTLQFAPTHQRARLATIPREVASGSLHGRTRIWKSGLKAFRHRPIRGVGSGAYPEAVRPWLGTPTVAGFQYVAHNTFLSVLVETGLVGFGIYALLLGVLAVFIWTMHSAERALWAIVMAAWAVGVSTLTWEQYKPTWLIMALITTQWASSWWHTDREP